MRKLLQKLEFTLPKTTISITTSYLQITCLAIMYLILTIWGNIALVHNQASASWYFWFNCTTITTFCISSVQYQIPEKYTKWLKRVAIPLVMFLTLCMTEIANTHLPGCNPIFFLIISFYFWLYLFGYALFGQYRIAIFVVTPLLWMVNTANYYIMKFRGTAFLPLDIFYADTAATVAQSYNFTPCHKLIFSTALLALIICIAVKLHPNRKTKAKYIAKRVIAGLLTVFLFGSYFTTDVLTDIGFHPDFYKQEYTTSKFGAPMNFWMNLNYLTPKKPAGYNPENIKDKMLNILGDTQYSATQNKKPHVICIMNEAFSDIAMRGEFSTNMDYMPFVRGLTENTIKGNLYVPVFGNGTCNSELEFLTGYSTAFAPIGSKPYSLYIKNEIPSLARIFRESGYNTIAFHPYYKNNWNRPAVYNHMNFAQYYGMEDVISKDTLQLMQSYAPLNDIIASLQETYPGKEYLTREYLNDAFNNDKIIEWYEANKVNDAPLFVFNVTMQNHGGYEATENIQQEIYITNEDGTPKAGVERTNQYLSLVYESDKQLQKLIEYFQEQEEPVVVLMFGDHQANTGDTEWLRALSGIQYESDATPKQNQDKYITPFFIWANYDIEERQIERLSVNYLSSYLMQAIGMEMPLYNQYLLKLSETLPVINTQGYIDKNGVYYNFESNSPYTSIIEDYKHICYNLLFDTKHRCHELYTP